MLFEVLPCMWVHQPASLMLMGRFTYLLLLKLLLPFLSNIKTQLLLQAFTEVPSCMDCRVPNLSSVKVSYRLSQTIAIVSCTEPAHKRSPQLSPLTVYLHWRRGWEGSWNPHLSIQLSFPTILRQFCPNYIVSWEKTRGYSMEGPGEEPPSV